MKPLKKKPFNIGKGATAKMYYEDQNENPVPVSTMLGLPVTGIGTSIKRGIYIYPTGSYDEAVKKLSNPRVDSFVTVENPYNMFDGKFDTYSKWYYYNVLSTPPNIYMHFGGNGFVLTSLVMYVVFDRGSIDDIDFTAMDIDGKSYTLSKKTTPIDISGNTYTLVTITGFPNKEVVEVTSKSNLGNFGEVFMDVYELRFNKKSVFGGTIDVDIPSQRDVITLDDIYQIKNLDHLSLVDDLSKMFDNDLNTYTHFSTGNEGRAHFSVETTESWKINDVVIRTHPSAQWRTSFPPKLKYNYIDGTDSGYLNMEFGYSDTANNYYILLSHNPFLDRRVKSIEYDSDDSLIETEDIYEFYAYKLKEEYTIDTSGTVINPPTKEIQGEVRDQLSLPNEDINIQTSPSANTDYSVKIDVGRGNKVVTSLYSDQTPSSVKVYGSNDNTNFFELDSISIDVSSWNTSKYNVYEFEPYTRYVKITLTTPSTVPTRVDMRIAGVRT